MDKILNDENKVTISTDLTTGQMIERLKVGEEAEYKLLNKMTSHHLVVRKIYSEAIIIVRNDFKPEYRGQELVLTSEIMSYTWTIYSKSVSIYEAMKAHQIDKKTISYHHDDEITYTFIHELSGFGQFQELSSDSISLYELIDGKWTIDN